MRSEVRFLEDFLCFERWRKSPAIDPHRLRFRLGSGPDRPAGVAGARRSGVVASRRDRGVERVGADSPLLDRHSALIAPWVSGYPEILRHGARTSVARFQERRVAGAGRDSVAISMESRPHDVRDVA